MRLRFFLLSLMVSLMLCAGALAQTIALTFLGDTSVGDAYPYRSYERSYHQLVAREGAGWPFSLVCDVLKADDLTIANLEGTMTTYKRHKDIRHPLIIDPSHTAVLLAGGIDLVNTANNHAWDFYQEGYLDTLATLDGAGIRHFGTVSPERTGIDRQELVEIKGIKIGFVGYSYPQNSDLTRLEKAVAALREEGCSLIILSLHWGRETYMTQNATQVNFARKAFETGVDLIWGHHPHVIQPIALYDGKPIFFSTGNFTFGTMSPVNPSTGMFQVVYEVEQGTPSLKSIQVIPCLTSGSGDYRPVPVTDEAQRKAIFEVLSLRKPPEGFEALPESFELTGEVLFED